MPEINLTVKIVSGKRKPLEVYVESRSINREPIFLKSGYSLSHDEIEIVIDNAVVKYLGER